ncbi:MAG: peptidylprolyl isomerase [Anaerolineae bacterium]
MSKRSQTTALPKGTKNAPKAESTEPGKKPPQIQREYHSHAEREQQIQRWIIRGTLIAVGLVILVLAITVIIDAFVIPNQVVASVDGQNISISQFQKRVRLERYLRNQQLTNLINTYSSFGYTQEQIGQQLQSQEPYATWIRELQVPDQMGLNVVNTLVDEQLIRNAAKEKGITVTQAEIDKKVEDFFQFTPVQDISSEATAEVTATVEPTVTPTPYVSPTPSPTATLTPVPEITATPSSTPIATLPPEPTKTADEAQKAFQTDRDTFFRDVRKNTGMSDGDINAYFELRALQDALTSNVAADITKTGMFVNVRHILVATEEEAQDILSAIENGESFSDLAKSISTDTGSGANGGELGWAPVTQYVKEFQEAARTAEIGAIVGPVKTEFGYHIIQVRAREDRELSDSELEQAKSGAFSTWFDEYKASKTDKTQTNSVWANYVPTDPVTVFG